MPTLEKIKKFAVIFIRDLFLFTLIFFLLLALLVGWLMSGKTEPAEKITYGVTFSQLFAEQLDLDWPQAYLAILDDLAVKKLRLVAYWPILEPVAGQYSFDDLDWQISEAGQRKAEIILVVGRRVPRWPECHIPDWAKSLGEDQQQEKILELIEKIVERYKDNKTIKYWQVENEPFLRHFGQCPKLDKKFLAKEIALVERLDYRPIILTTSGEISSWIGPARRTKILGTTLYRTVWNKYLKNYLTYPITPIFYHKRASFVKKFFDVDRVFVSELAAEPWGPKQIYESSLEEQFVSMNAEKFRETIDYIKKTGLDEFYFWGAEWWYWLKEKHNDNSMWYEAKKLWQ